MSDTLPRRPLAAVAATAALAIASLGLAACGGSSGSSNTGANNAAATGTATQSSNGLPANRVHPPAGAFKDIRRPRPGAFKECLSKNGVKLPAGRNGPLLGGAGLPKNVNRQQLQTAMRKCMGSRFQGAGGPGARPGVAGPGPGAVRFRQALAKFAACLRQNGVNLPAPNTAGHGPMFSTKGVNTASPQFRAATAKCRTTLTSALRGRP